MIDQWITDEIDNLCHVEYGTRVVQKTDGGTIYPVYGGGGPTFAMDTYNREDRLVIARFAMSAKCTRFVKGKFFLNDSGLTLSPKDRSKIDQEFLNYQCLALNNVFYSLAKGSAQKNLDVPAFRKLKLNIPKDINTQKNIVLKLDAILAAIDKATAATEANARNAEALFQSYLRKIFDENKEWKKSSIGEVLVLIKNGINCEQSKTQIGEKITRIETIAKKKFDFQRVGYAKLSDAERQKSQLKVGDILFSHINSPAHVGKTAIFNGEEPIYHGINLLLMRTHKDVNPYFFNAFLNYLFATGYWERNCKKAVNQASVNQKDISKVGFSYPTLEIQQELLGKIDAISSHISLISKLYERKKNDLIVLKQSILSRAFSGCLVRE